MQEEAQSYTLPAPVGGWNARDPLDVMAETDAIGLVNIIPDTSVCRLRRGFREHADTMGTGAVETLAEFSSAAGTKKLLSAANGNIYDCTTFGAAGTSLGSGFSSNKWQTTNFRASGSNYIVFANGVDQPKKWDGTTFNDAAYTDAGLPDDAVLVQPWAYKSRIYLVEINTTRFWYTSTGAVQGAVTVEDLASIFSRGGYLQWVSSWSRNISSGVAEFFVACSSMGEVLVYQGSYPGDTTTPWALVGRYFLPPPIGRRSFFHLDGDLCILTTRGVIPLSRVVGATDAQTYTTVSDKIQKAFNDSASSYSTNFGWQGVVYSRGNYALINLPMVEGGRSEQYIMNLMTGAWAQFQGQNAACWAIHNDKLYFGGTSGGTVYEADSSQDDNGANIEGYIKQAFSYYGDRSRKKRMLMARPILTGSPQISFAIGMDVDFSNQTLTGTVTTSGATGSEWNTAPWNTSPWSEGDEVSADDWYGISGLGRCGALRLQGEFNGVSWALNATQIIFEPGNYI